MVNRGAQAGAECLGRLSAPGSECALKVRDLRFVAAVAALMILGQVAGRTAWPVGAHVFGSAPAPTTAVFVSFVGSIAGLAALAFLIVRYGRRPVARRAVESRDESDE